MNKQEREEAAKELTFHSCLLQVLQNRTEDLSSMPKLYVKGVKQKGNMFKDEIDRKLTPLYNACNEEEIGQSMDLIEVISDKLDEAFAYYEEKHNQKEI